MIFIEWTYDNFFTNLFSCLRVFINDLSWLCLHFACIAFVSDTPGEEKYALELRKLEPKDILFMYVSDRSIVIAVGAVSKRCRCDGRQYTGTDRLVYKGTCYTESRLPVNWCIPLKDNPIEKEDLKKIFGSGPFEWFPRRTTKNLDPEKAKQLLNLARERNKR